MQQLKKTRIKEPAKVIDSITYGLNECSDNPYTFERVPSWLQTALVMGAIKGQFRSEDYWYLVIETPEGDMLDVAPGDEILYYDDDTIGVKVNKF